VEIVALDDTDAVIWSSGTVEDDEPLREVIARDPDVWWLGDWARKADGSDAHAFWEVDDIESSVLVAPSRFSPDDPRYEEPHVSRTWDLTGLFPSRVDVAVHIPHRTRCARCAHRVWRSRPDIPREDAHLYSGRLTNDVGGRVR
jgi:hypothetical protein